MFSKIAMEFGFQRGDWVLGCSMQHWLQLQYETDCRLYPNPPNLPNPSHLPNSCPHPPNPRFKDVTQQ